MSLLLRAWCLVAAAGLCGLSASALSAAETTAGPAVVLGGKLFRHNFARPGLWTDSTPLGSGGDGLGPLYNDVACAACHSQAGEGGGGPNEQNALVLSYFTRSGLSRPQLEAAVREAAQLHPQLSATQTNTPLHRFGLPTGRDQRPYEEFLAGVFDQVTLNPRDTAPAVGTKGLVQFEVCQRNTIALWGAGAIDELRQQEGDAIRERLMEEQNRSFPWLSGRVPRDAQQRPAWFGWRGQTVSLHEFNLGACATELGLNVPTVSQHRSPVAETEAAATRLDLTAEQCVALTAFVASLPRPQQVLPADPSAAASVALGEQVFNNCRCQACHTRDLGWLTGIYSDLLLHDMGPRLCDHMEAMFELLPGEVLPAVTLNSGPYSSPPKNILIPPKIKPTNCECEWKTPPLWGVADSAPYLHDGRAATLDEAIRWHGGEAETSRLAYLQLPPQEASLLMSFLGSLRAPSAVVPSLAVAAPAASPVPNVAPVAMTPAPVVPPPVDEPLETVPLPPFVPVEIKPADYARLVELVQLTPKAAQLPRASAIVQQLPAELQSAGTYVLALLQKQCLQHQASQDLLSGLSTRGGPFAAKARQAAIRQELRSRNYRAAAAALQSHVVQILADTSLPPRDVAEQVQWAGLVIGWLSGPAGVEASRFDATDAAANLRALLAPDLRSHFEYGQERVAQLQATLLAERAACLGVQATEQQSRQAELARQQQQLAAEKSSLTASQVEWEADAKLELAKLDEQLAELEKQYLEQSSTEERLGGLCNSLKGQILTIQSLLATAPQTSRQGWGPSRSSAPTTTDMLALNDKLAFFSRQREENAAQARITTFKGEQLVQSRRQLMAEYQRRTGQTLQQSALLNRWQQRVEREATALEASPAEKSKAVQRLDRKLRDLATYDPYNAAEEAPLLLARYRPVE